MRVVFEESAAQATLLSPPCSAKAPCFARTGTKCASLLQHGMASQRFRGAGARPQATWTRRWTGRTLGVTRSWQRRQDPFHAPLRESPYPAPRARRAPFLPPRRVPARPSSPLMLPTSRRVQVVLRERHGLGQDALAREERSDRLQSQVRHRLPSSSPSRKDGRHGDSSPAVPRFEACPGQKHHSALLP